MLLLPAALILIAPVVTIDRPMPAPDWALAQRAVFQANAEAAREFFDKYVDSRGYLRCVERWGGNDGPDDAMENFQNWTLFYVLGGSQSVLEMFSKAWEGNIVQYTKARAPSVEMARDGMYHKEFITSFDWEHTGEGLAAFHFYALARPGDTSYVRRVRRFAGFYMNEDPGAPNYDPKNRIILSLHNGSRGPKLTPATERDWGGEPVPGSPERLARYRHASNIRGDHPLNLCAATLAFNAYALTGERKYRDWLLEYVGAWRGRILENGGNIPTNIGLDGKIGGEWGGKWYGGVFGWDFDPSTAGRNYYMRGPRIALGEAILLTGDLGFALPLRAQLDNLYAVRRVEKGRVLLPNKHGGKGWYGYTADRHTDVQKDLYLWSMSAEDRARLEDDPWIRYLEGRNAGYPKAAFDAEVQRTRRRQAGIRADTSDPAARPSDHPQKFNPVSTAALVNLMLGANDPGTSGNALHARLFYFDPAGSRTGLPDGTAALVESITAGGVVVTLVNLDGRNPRDIVVQAGAYGEHHFDGVEVEGRRTRIDGRRFTVRLSAGAGAKLAVGMRRWAHPPSIR